MNTSRAGSRKRIGIFGLVSKHAGRNWGGTATNIHRLANYFLRQGLQVDILMRAQSGHFLFDSLASGVTVRQVAASSKQGLFLALLNYARKEQPDVILSLETRANQIASWLTFVPRLRTRVWSSCHSALDQDQSPLLHKIARRSHGVITISHGLADEFRRLSGIPPEKLHVIHNLVVSPELAILAREPVDHPWLTNGNCRVVCGIGRLVAEKGFQYLIEALPLVKTTCPDTRLIIIGQGPLLEQLRQVSNRLGLHDSIDFIGFQKNPWAYLARADVFVMPSLAEAFGNVLAEALSLGIPSVASDCPYGPAEILAQGRYGRLVPPADSRALADAIIETLREPPRREPLIAGAQRFSEEVAGRTYLETLGLV